MSKLPKLIAIVGTNASGKSAIGIELAKHFGGEIISADSRQVFKGLDLGSGKVTPEEMQGVPHHLIDICEPGEFFSMHDFQKLAYEAADGILGRNRLPFIVGGTGLYVDSVTEGYVMSDTPPDLEYRAHLETFSTEVLYDMLTKLRPDVEVDSANRNRVMRILEKIHDGDDVEGKRCPRYDCLKIGVTWDRPTLRDRIDERLERRLQQGMIDEVKGLLDSGVSEQFLIKLGLEYKFITWYLTGEISSLDEMKELLATAIKQFAKRQQIWFRKDKSIHWLDMRDRPFDEAVRLIEQFTEADE